MFPTSFLLFYSLFALTVFAGTLVVALESW